MRLISWDGEGDLPSPRDVSQSDLISEIKKYTTRRCILMVDGRKVKEYNRKSCALRFALSDTARLYTWLLVQDALEENWRITP